MCEGYDVFYRDVNGNGKIDRIEQTGAKCKHTAHIVGVNATENGEVIVSESSSLKPALYMQNPNSLLEKPVSGYWFADANKPNSTYHFTTVDAKSNASN